MDSDGSGWAFIGRHRVAVSAFAVAAVALAAWAVYVFWWFTGNAQSTGLVPSSLGAWTMGNLVNLIIYAILWELVLVGIPVALVAIVGWMWWKKLPVSEKTMNRWRGGRGTARGSGFGFLFFIAFAIKVYLDGNWNMPISAYSLNYVVGSLITILAVLAAIVGIPVAIGLIWWASRMSKRAHAN